jgi:hypothetical protein
MKKFNCILILLFFCSSAEQINLPFGTYFQPKITETGEVLTIAAFTTDSSYFYLYDMADRSIAVVDSTGVFLKKLFLQGIGRKTYIGDDFIVRKGEAIFLNAVDFRIEYFDMETGVLKKSLPYPHEIPSDNPKRRYRMITRIFLDESKIYLGNIHSVFLFDEKTVLQKKSTMKINY